jgi:hypothetical protein
MHHSEASTVNHVQMPIAANTGATPVQSEAAHLRVGKHY